MCVCVCVCVCVLNRMTKFLAIMTHGIEFFSTILENYFLWTSEVSDIRKVILKISLRTKRISRIRNGEKKNEKEYFSVPFLSVTYNNYCICICFDGVVIAALRTRLFKIYCAPPNLGITRM